MSANPGVALLKLEVDLYMKGKKKASGASTSKVLKAHIGQKDQNDDKSDFPVYLFIRPEMIGAITCLEPESESGSNSSHTVLQFLMAEAAEVIYPPDANFSQLRDTSFTRWNQFRTLSGADEFSVSFDRGNKVKKDDINYLVDLFSSNNELNRPHADERRGNIATLYSGAGGRIWRIEKDKSTKANPPPYTKKNIHNKRPHSNSGEFENSHHPSKRLNARFQKLEARFTIIENKMDDHYCELSTDAAANLHAELDAKWDDLHADMLLTADRMEAEHGLALTEVRDDLKVFFQESQLKTAAKTADLVSDIALNTAKDVVADAVKDVLKDDILEVVNKVVEDGVKYALEKKVEYIAKAAVEATRKDMMEEMKRELKKDMMEEMKRELKKDVMEEVKRDVKKALMKGLAFGLNN